MEKAGVGDGRRKLGGKEGDWEGGRNERVWEGRMGGWREVWKQQEK